MTLQELRYVVALADEGHFARAARRCHISQSTLSTQIRKLEQYLGVTLFDRSQRHIVPSPVGAQVVAQARLVLDEAGKVREIAAQESDVMAGSLRLGAIPTLGPYFLPLLLPVLRQAYPQLRLLLTEDLTARLIERLQDGRLDAALLTLPVSHESFRAKPLFREPFQVALPAGHRLADRGQILPSDLDGECLLLLEDGHCLRDQALDVCGSSRSREREEVKATSLETLRQMVAGGVGCTLLPTLAAGAPHHLGATRLIEMRPFATPIPSRTVGIVWRKRSARDAAIMQLAALIKADLPAGVDPAT